MKSTLILWIGLLLTAYSFSSQDLDAEQSSQTSTAFTILFDNSGSMEKDGKIKQAKSAFSAWLSAQDPENAYSLIHFSSGGTVAVPLENNTLTQVQSVVNRLTARGQTPIVNCLKLAHKNIEKRRENFSPYERHIVVVFTDGYESLDSEGNKGVVREIRKLTADGIEVTGIGFHGQGRYMQKAATQYFDAYNTDELKKSLDKVSAEIDPNVEVFMTERDAEMMEQIDLVSLIPVPTPTDSEAEGNSTSSSGFSFRWIFILALFGIILIRILKKVF